ncbi:MAG: hypothetical protein ACTSUE_17455, partial [Promethearchaeota archaeon]
VKIYDGEPASFWCYLEPGRVVVKVYDYTEKTFIDDEQENTEHYSMMAQSGAMNYALIAVMERDPQMTRVWLSLTTRIDLDRLPLALNEEKEMEPPLNLDPGRLSEWFLTKFRSRFEQAFYGTHDGNVKSFIAEYQYAFVKFSVENDQDALERWKKLVFGFTNAGERRIEENPALFSELADLLLIQLKLIPPGTLDRSDPIIVGAGNLAEDMIDTGIDLLVNRGEALDRFIQIAR